MTCSQGIYILRSFVSSILTLGRSTLETEAQTVFLKDSLDIVAQDRESIVRAIENASHNRVVITHGTDSIAETATFLESYSLGKTIVLTGAMMPILSVQVMLFLI